MKKEVIIAIVAGLILGLIITIGIYTANRSLNQQRTKKQVQSQPSPSFSPLATKNLNLTSHESFDLVGDSQISLGGVAWPGAVIALISEADNQIIAADNEGVFVFTAKLIKGFNEITVAAADESGTVINQNLVITYSTNTFDQPTGWLRPGLIRPAYAQESAPPEQVTDKIKERLQETAAEGLVSIKEQLTAKSGSPRKKAYIGRVASLDEAGLTLIYKDQQFSVSFRPDTVFVKGAATVINQKDLSVGDFVIAMGWQYPDKDSLTAMRLSLINQPEPPANRQLLAGKINEIDGQKISLAGKDLTLSKKTALTVGGIDSPTTEDLVLGDNLFAIVTLDSNGNISQINAVLVVPGKNNPAGLVPTNIDATASGQATPSAKDEN